MRYLLISSMIGMILFSGVSAMAGEWVQSEWGQTAIFKMENAPYPHESRAEGYQGSSQFYPRDPHYIDNSVGLFIPNGYRPGRKTDLLLYLHGHGNNVRKAFEKFDLRQQVVASGKNVIFVFPEGPKDAGDSGCGKLEDPGGLARLVQEVLEKLKEEGKIETTNPGKVLLAGHSGAYKGLSYCVEHGGLEDHVTEVFLLDATYARLEQFANWVDRNRRARLRTIFTEHLANDNVEMMAMIDLKGLRYRVLMDVDATDRILARTRILFLHTATLKHNETVQWLEKFMRNSRLEDVER